MKSNRIRLVVLLGLIAISGIVGVQLHWLNEAFDNEEQKFSEKVHIALLEVVKDLYGKQHQNLPLYNPIRAVSKDYYVVNINNDFNAEVLEHHLKNEFNKFKVETDFEYAIYNCDTDEMVYGNYIQQGNSAAPQRESYFPKFENLVYYFAVRFPDRTNYFLSSLQLWLILSGVLFVVLIIYVYSIFIILQQKRFSELQKDFINNMTHEFKTPLSSILIASNYLARHPEIQSDERLLRYSETIVNQAGRLNQHVEKILNLAKSESSPIKLELSTFPVVDLLESVRSNFITRHPETSIMLSYDHSYSIRADKVHFSNVVYNLLDNAVKYCDAQPQIEIRLQENEGALQFEFIDNGVGIPVKHQQMIFRKFYRIPHNTNSPSHGFGLGLFYVKNICQQHRWKLDLSSIPGAGTTFRILVPNPVRL